MLRDRRAAFGAVMAQVKAKRGRAAGGPRYLLDYTTASVVRASSAWNLDKRNGTPTWHEFASGEARVLNDGAVYIEGARTNLAENADTSANPPWLSVGTPTRTAGQADIAGGTTAARLQLDSGADAVFDGLTHGAGNYCLSLFAKKGSVGSTGILAAQFGGTPSVGQSVAWADLTDDFVRKAHVVTWPGTATDNVIVAEARTTGAAVAGDRDVVLSHVQYEAGSFPSQPIVTTGAGPVTRAADNVSFASTPEPMLSSKWAIDYTPGASSADLLGSGADHTILCFGGTNADRLYMVIGASSIVMRIRESGADVITSSTITFSANQRLTFTLDMVAGTLTIAGATTGNGTTAKGSALAFPAGTLQVGNVATGTAYAFGAIGRPYEVA